jgi:hypothetical protein
MILTKEDLAEARSTLGGYSFKQYGLIGVPVAPTPSGWRRLVLGKDYPPEVIAEFIALKDKHMTPGKIKYQLAYKQKKLEARRARQMAEGGALV